MSMESINLPTSQLHMRFIRALAEHVSYISDTEQKPLLIDFEENRNIRLRAYIYNCTNPPGGRSPDEFKCQLMVPGQQRGCRGQFDFGDGRTVLLVGYAQIPYFVEGGVFIIWDSLCHMDFAFSANIQIREMYISQALSRNIVKISKKTGEIVIVSQPHCLYNALMDRIATISPMLQS